MVLTADRSVMNDNHFNWRSSLPTWASTDFYPEHGFGLFAKRSRNVGGTPIFAPLAIRKVEGALRKKGYRVKVVLPEYLPKYISRTRSVGISTIDPQGMAFGPLYLHMFTNSKVSKVEFEKLVGSSILQKARKKGVKLIVGGSGVWQLGEGRPEIDCIVGGESERILPKLLDDIKDGRNIPKKVTCDRSTAPTMEDLARNSGPTQFGILQVGRGCPRMCKFCTVSGKLQWVPLKQLEWETRMNNKAGMDHAQIVCEDLLLYGSKTIIPRDNKFLELVSTIGKHNRFVSLSHFSVSSINQRPDLFQKLHEHVPETQKFAVAQTGVETGSDRLIEKMSPAKKAPFKDQNWADLVINTTNILEDSIVFPYYTFLVGGPTETVRDVEKTLALIEDIYHNKSIMMPCLYTLEERPHQDVKDLMEIEKQLVKLCFDHNGKWYKYLTDRIIELYPYNKKISTFVRDRVYDLAYLRLKRRFKECNIDMDKEATQKSEVISMSAKEVRST